MFTLFIILTIIASILLIFIVLIQNPKGGGIASNFSAGNQVMGVRKTSEFVEKATWGLAIAILVFAMAGNLFIGGTTETAQESIMQEQIESAEMPAAPLTPNQPGANGQPNPIQGGSQGQGQPANPDGAVSQPESDEIGTIPGADKE